MHDKDYSVEKFAILLFQWMQILIATLLFRMGGKSTALFSRMLPGSIGRGIVKKSSNIAERRCCFNRGVARRIAAQRALLSTRTGLAAAVSVDLRADQVGSFARVACMAR
ncbi:hypothetical protein [Rhizobium sp. 18055]|uniref:hypothetical protein n=1 Tax=Rhizobium sp. 18055 TaxID=2681403 RepID=UPI001357710D|nr:hypothetical protein [Rhizobium sp. 18055]